jgi:LAO/AO transport system kinase
MAPSSAGSSERDPREEADIATLAAQVRSGSRRGLARAITLVESTRADHRAEATALLGELLPHTGNAIRIGISGAPGSGKSTFIEAFGLSLAEQGRAVAVLAVDPSSERSGGSILGDKTRMEVLARDPNVYIRPSPSSGAVGGVAPRTREAVLLCEAAGFEIVLVETVGVGQSETEVDQMVDVFVLLAAPAAGDELQGIKRGVMELVDVLVVTKADGELKAAANRAANDYRAALRLMRPKHTGMAPQVVVTSALDQEGIDDVWQLVVDYERSLRDSGELGRLRARQAVQWMWAEVRARVFADFTASPKVSGLIDDLERDVAAAKTTPSAAADRLIAAFKPS